MKQKSIVASTFFALALPLVGGNNLYENPGFESWNPEKNLPSARTWRWSLPKQGFAVMERSNDEKYSGEYSLHLKDSDDGLSNSGLGYVISSADARRYRGRVMHFSARVKQLSASRPKVVGISLFVRGAKPHYAMAMVDAAGPTDWGLLKTSIRLPEDTTVIIAYLQCADGFRNTAEALFDDVVLTVDEAPEVTGSAPQPVVEKKSRGTVAPGKVFLSLYPVPPSWRARSWGGLVWRDKVGSRPEMRFEIPRQSSAFAGVSVETDYLDRRYNLANLPLNKIFLEFLLSKNLPVAIRMTEGRQIRLGGGTPAGKRFLYQVPLSQFQLRELRFSGVTIQFPEPIAAGSTLELSGLALRTEAELSSLSYVKVPEVEAYRASYWKKQEFVKDNWTRPEIRNGTWYLNGKPYFFLGPWIYNDNHGNWNKDANPLNISHIAYREAPSEEVWRVMGFNSAQISAAHSQPGAAIYGLPVHRNFQTVEQRITDYFQRLGATPLVLDFAFGFNRMIEAEDPAKYKELDQRKGSWHGFILFCPENPEGDRYYQSYFLGGVKAALKNRANVFVYELFNESAYNCECRFNAREFARRMEKKYGTIQKANAVWGTLFENFGEVAEVSNFQIYRKLWPDWCRFSADRYAELLKKYAALIRTVDRRPNVYFTEQAWGAPPSQPGMDYRRIAEVLDVLTLEGGWQYGFNSNLVARNEMEEIVMSGGSKQWFNCDFFQALAKGRKPVMNDEHYCLRSENGLRVPSRKEDMITSLWMEILHGVSSNYTYVWDKRAWEWKSFEQAKANVIHPSYRSSSLLNPYNWPVSELDAFQQFRREFEPYLEKVMPFPRTKPATVAVFFSYPTMQMQPYYSWKFMKRMVHWYSTLLHAQFPVKVVFEEELAAGLGPEVQALIFPAADYATPETVRHAEAFRRRGGVVIAERNALRMDEYSRALPAEKKFLRIDAEKPEQMIPILQKNNVKRYGTITPADGKGAIRMTDLQIVDRGDFKLVFLVAMGEPAVRLTKVSLNLEDGGSFYLCDAIRRRILLNGKKECWSAEELRRGFEVVLPSQQRVVLTLERTRPAGMEQSVSVEALREEFRQQQRQEQPALAAFAAERKRLQKVYQEERVWHGVNAEKCVKLDLSGFVNMAFRDEIAGDRKGGWFDQGGNDFANMPLGDRVFAGVPFRIIDPAANGNKGVIVLAGKERDYFPAEVLGIPVNRKAAALYFLHTMGWGEKGQKALTYRIHYVDGSSLEIPVVGERDICGWWGAKAAPNAKIAVEVPNAQKDVVSMQCFRWRNPYPEKEIRSLDVVSARESAVPALAAVTVETP